MDNLDNLERNAYTGFGRPPALMSGHVPGGEQQESIGTLIRSSLENPRDNNSGSASPSSSRTSQICNGDLMKQLECLICTDIMEPPVHLCTNGHSLCGKCRPRMSRCGFCAGSFIARNHCVENILNGCSAQCEFHSRGCSQIIKLSEFASHVNLCTFNPNPSPPPESDLRSDFNGATTRDIGVELQRLNHQNLVTLSMLQQLGPIPTLGQNTQRYQEDLDNLTLRMRNQTENMNPQEIMRNEIENTNREVLRLRNPTGNMNQETLRLNREFDGVRDRVISHHQTYRQQLNELRASCLNSYTSPGSSMMDTSPIANAPVVVLIEDDGSPFTASDVTSSESISSTSNLRPQPPTPTRQPLFVRSNRTYFQTGSPGGDGNFRIPSVRSLAARNRRNEAIQNTLFQSSSSPTGPTRSIPPFPPRIAATAVPNEARQQIISVSRFPINQMQPAINTHGRHVHVTATEAEFVAVSGANANGTQARTVTGANDNATQGRTVSGFRSHQSSRRGAPDSLPRSHRPSIVQPGRYVSRRLSSAHHPQQSRINSSQSASSVNQNSSNPRSRHVSASSNQHFQRPSNGTVTPQRAPLSANHGSQEQSVLTSFDMGSLGWHTVQTSQRQSPALRRFSTPLQQQPSQVGNVNVNQSPFSDLISSWYLVGNCPISSPSPDDLSLFD